MGASVQISRRLCAIADLVTEGNRLVDVGCDHGYLPVYLKLQGRIPSAIATDVAEGPLSRAREHIRQYGLDSYIETRRCDGLADVGRGEGDTLVIAGMGGPLMERILTDGRSVWEDFKEMILQPQSDIPHFRHFLLENGFHITEEEMILEDGKFYPILKVNRQTEEQPELWSVQEEMFGRFLLERKHPVLRKYLERELRIHEEILAKLKEASGEMAAKRKKEIEEERQLILAALNRYES
ncbi:MAG: class I SAM-dependent methyltransferase [Eubacteriales bacterium]|nr:class I SAM-dependent methyltransferase [Eubacteriales bacterium]